MGNWKSRSRPREAADFFSDTLVFIGFPVENDVVLRRKYAFWQHYYSFMRSSRPSDFNLPHDSRPSDFNLPLNDRICVRVISIYHTRFASECFQFTSHDSRPSDFNLPLNDRIRVRVISIYLTWFASECFQFTSRVISIYHWTKDSRPSDFNLPGREFCLRFTTVNWNHPDFVTQIQHGKLKPPGREYCDSESDSTR